MTPGRGPTLPIATFECKASFDPLYVNVEETLLPTIDTLKNWESKTMAFSLVRGYFTAK